MVDTFKLRKPLPEGTKVEFEDSNELLEYLISLNENDQLPEEELGKLYSLPEEEITDEMRERIRISKLKDPKDYVDIRDYVNKGG